MTGDEMTRYKMTRGRNDRDEMTGDEMKGDELYGNHNEGLVVMIHAKVGGCREWCEKGLRRQLRENSSSSACKRVQEQILQQN
jgi:hypothetical protein